MAIYFDNSNIITGSRGPEGPQGIQGKQGPAGPNEISTDTASSITGILKGNGSTVAVAEAGVDYATSEQAKPFVVTFTLNENNEIITVDKTTQEIIAAHNAKRMVLAIILTPYGINILQLAAVLESKNIVAFTLLGDNTLNMLIGTGSTWRLNTYNLAVKPNTATALPASGTALTANTIYAVADAVGTYAFTPPSSGWAHGKFTTGASVSVSFSGTFVGAAPTIEASKIYEFDVFDGVWAVQEVVTA